MTRQQDKRGQMEGARTEKDKFIKRQRKDEARDRVDEAKVR